MLMFILIWRHQHLLCWWNRLMCRKFILGWRLICQNCLFLFFLIRSVILLICCMWLTFRGSLFFRSFVGRWWKKGMVVEGGLIVVVMVVRLVLGGIITFLLMLVLGLLLMHLFQISSFVVVVAVQVGSQHQTSLSFVHLVAQTMTQYQQYSSLGIMMAFLTFLFILHLIVVALE